MSYSLSPIPNTPHHFRVWIDGREVGYLRYADEATPQPLWRACDDVGERVVEGAGKADVARRFAAQFGGES